MPTHPPAPPADKVTKLEIYVLGDRNFPFGPVAKVEADGIPELLGPLVAEARRRLPDTTYGDAIKLALRIGLSQIPHIFAAGGRIERGGLVSFMPLNRGSKSEAAQMAERNRLNEARVLDWGASTLTIGEREEFLPPGPQGPKDTIPKFPVGGDAPLPNLP